MKRLTHNKKRRHLFHVPCSIFDGRGFTLFEIIIVVAILAVLIGIAIPSIVSLQKLPQLNNTAEEIISALRTAQNKTLSSEANSQYGVYFNTASSPHQYILFKGSSYALRDTSFDQVNGIPSILEFYAVNTGPTSQVVFDKLTGSTANSGNISLRLKEDTSQTKIIYVDNSGIVGFTALSVPSDSARVKDSRHVDFDYSRTIDTANENMILTFNGSTIETIPFGPFVINGQFDWTGTFTIGGTDQTVRIHTLRLNNPNTQVSVFRDPRFNDKSLTMKLSGDNTGTLAEYSADGLTTDFHSIYVSNFAWQ